ncbi:GNAT family N-acetyltransferase [Paenibacillus sp. MMS20-IR301]|uniref:GNAT family N-acetyltransferase n=1 Tax=Paenibacillus sp. MMS20-IR301 TaxID=2895946 RepID=UPI0028F12F95|nr:GNAT family N-acetyltransferase [Paenibacillus sp. MMS20-IR301]WNS45951.1 GNAT family N-acetyltransferase [Paenibacillus sp. MMS20-IR301]
MSDYQIRLMDEQSAREILHWKYDAPYAMYNMMEDSDDSEDIEELMDGSYFGVRTPDGTLIGFFCYGRNAQVGGGVQQGLYLDGTALDIGLGLRPELTGGGRGLAFLQAGMKFGQQNYPARRFRLSVAAFNLRAVSLYKKAGFLPGQRFVNRYGDSETEFLLMETAGPF